MHAGCKIQLSHIEYYFTLSLVVVCACTNACILLEYNTKVPQKSVSK